MTWQDVSSDPNDPEVVAQRQRVLDATWAPSPPDRISFLQQRCSGRRVLDIGCADHTDDARTRPSWLHQRLSEISSSCVGADINGPAVAALRDDGHDVVEVDITAGAGPLTDLEPFDVVVAGEVIEHLHDPLCLLRNVRPLLAPGGELIITTPNPYAPHRVYAGRTRFAWENADHLFYVFPSGLIELAERAGFSLTAVTTTQWDDRKLAFKQSLHHWRRALVGRDTAPGRARRPGWHRYIPPLEVLSTWRLWRNGMMGETAVYVLEPKG